MAPRAINARPGQFAFSPKLRPTVFPLGSSVTPSPERDRRASLNRPRQIACAAVNSTPPKTKNAPIQMSSNVASHPSRDRLTVDPIGIT
jgi:hypothetical protein